MRIPTKWREAEDVLPLLYYTGTACAVHVLGGGCSKPTSISSYAALYERENRIQNSSRCFGTKNRVATLEYIGIRSCPHSIHMPHRIRCCSNILASRFDDGEKIWGRAAKKSIIPSIFVRSFIHLSAFFFLFGNRCSAFNDRNLLLMCIGVFHGFSFCSLASHFHPRLLTQWLLLLIASNAGWISVNWNCRDKIITIGCAVVAAVAAASTPWHYSVCLHFVCDTALRNGNVMSRKFVFFF